MYHGTHPLHLPHSLSLCISCFLYYHSGAVGISLAIALDNNVWSVTEDETYRRFTTQMFGMIGGTAFLTLVINGSTAGPILQKLGLAKSTDTRQKVLKLFEASYKKLVYENLVALLSDKRYACVRFAHVRQHVPPLQDLSLDDLNEAVRKHKETARDSKEPNLESVLSYLNGTGEGTTRDPDVEKAEGVHRQDSDPTDKDDTNKDAADSFVTEQGALKTDGDVHVLTELRTTFIEQLKWAYREQLINGDLDGRQGFLAYVITQGLEFAADDAQNGKPLKDWETSQLVSSKSIDRAESWAKKAYTLNGLVCKKHLGDEHSASPEFKTVRFTFLLATAMIEAHGVAEEKFKGEFMGKYPDEVATIVQESKHQTSLAKAKIAEFDATDVEVVTEHLFSTLLLNKGSKYIESLLTSGLLSEKEAQGYDGAIEKALDGIHRCSKYD